MHQNVFGNWTVPADGPILELTARLHIWSSWIIGRYKEGRVESRRERANKKKRGEGRWDDEPLTLKC